MRFITEVSTELSVVYPETIGDSAEESLRKKAQKFATAPDSVVCAEKFTLPARFLKPCRCLATPSQTLQVLETYKDEREKKKKCAEKFTLPARFLKPCRCLATPSQTLQVLETYKDEREKKKKCAEFSAHFVWYSSVRSTRPTKHLELGALFGLQPR